MSAAGWPPQHLPRHPLEWLPPPPPQAAWACWLPQLPAGASEPTSAAAARPLTGAAARPASRAGGSRTARRWRQSRGRHCPAGRQAGCRAAWRPGGPGGSRPPPPMTAPPAWPAAAASSPDCKCLRREWARRGRALAPHTVPRSRCPPPRPRAACAGHTGAPSPLWSSGRCCPGGCTRWRRVAPAC